MRKMSFGFAKGIASGIMLIGTLWFFALSFPTLVDALRSLPAALTGECEIVGPNDNILYGYAAWNIVCYVLMTIFPSCRDKNLTNE